MKKLIAVSALAAAFAAFADAESYRSASEFEGTELDAGLWVFDGATGTTDGSSIKAYDVEGNLATPTITSPGAIGSKYLELSTEGGILWRGFGTWDGTTPTPKQITEKGLFVDTLVQFTPTEDGEPPALGEGDKLAIWLNVSTPEGSAVPVTNLMVKAGSIDAEGSVTAATYTLAGKTVEAGQWYRLTVKSINNIYANEDYFHQGGFMVKIDGTALASTTPVADVATGGFVDQMAGSGFLTDAMVADLKAGKILPSLATGTPNVASTLSSVGFKGSGAIDDLVLTDEDPFYVESIDFTLNWPEGMSPVAYTIGDGEEQSLEGKTSGFKVSDAKPGDVIALLFRNTDGATKKFTATASDSVTSITAEEFTYGWPEYLGDAVDGAYEIDDAAELARFQKGVNNAKLATADTTFKLTADVELTEAWPGVGVYAEKKDSECAFKGTFDGDNHTISNFQLGRGKYRGLFVQVEGGTIKNLKVAVSESGAFAAGEGTAAGAVFVGYAQKSARLENLTTLAGTFAGTGHNVAGICVRITPSVDLIACTNKLSIVGDYSKAGGIVNIIQQDPVAGIVNFDKCSNEGSVMTTASTGITGVGGLLAYCGDAAEKGTTTINIKDCSSTGAVSAPNQSGAPVGYIFGAINTGSYVVIGSEVNKTKADKFPFGRNAGTRASGFDFATIEGDIATFVAPAINSSDTYKVMRTDATYVFTEAGSITFDNSLVTTFAPTAVEGLELSNEGYVWTAAAPAWPTDEGWAQDADDDVKAKFANWKGEYAGSFVSQAEAFLMGVAPGSTVPALTIDSITVDGTTATVVVSAGTADLSKVNGVLYVESSNNLTNWTAVEYDVATTGTVGADGKATFTVTAGKFMKAKIGFKNPTAK